MNSNTPVSPFYLFLLSNTKKTVYSAKNIIGCFVAVVKPLNGVANIKTHTFYYILAIFCLNQVR